MIRRRLAVAALFIASAGLIAFILALFNLVGWNVGGTGLLIMVVFGLAGGVNLEG